MALTVSPSQAYMRSLEMCRFGLLCGPSSGFNLEGLLQYLRRHQAAGTLDSLRSAPGAPLHAVFIACDGPYQYIDEYFDKCPAEAFPPIENERLLKVDLHRYDDAWEIGAAEAHEKLATAVKPAPAAATEEAPRNADALPRRGSDSSVASDATESSSSDSEQSETAPSTRRTSIASSADAHSSSKRGGALVLDLRRADEAQALVGNSVRVPLASLDASTPCPFADAGVLERQWRELDELLDPASAAPRSKQLQRLLAERAGSGGEVLLVCYAGGTARVASSLLRQRGYEAFSLSGGMQRWRSDGRPVVGVASDVQQLQHSESMLLI